MGGTIDGRQFRGTVSPADSGWAFTVSPPWMRDTGLAAGHEVIVELAPEGPQRGDLAEDISAALAANPAAAAFFDTLAQFYRKAYLRWIDATTRRPDLRAARIAEVVDLLAAGGQGTATTVSTRAWPPAPPDERPTRARLHLPVLTSSAPSAESWTTGCPTSLPAGCSPASAA